jgi:hypothetical protein
VFTRVFDRCAHRPPFLFCGMLPLLVLDLLGRCCVQLSRLAVCSSLHRRVCSISSRKRAPGYGLPGSRLTHRAIWWHADRDQPITTDGATRFRSSGLRIGTASAPSILSAHRWPSGGGAAAHGVA